jgi:hypothetical protein
VLKRYFVLVIALITAVVVGTATSTSAMQPQSKSTESMHTKRRQRKRRTAFSVLGRMLVEAPKRAAKLLRRVVARRARQLPRHQNR